LKPEPARSTLLRGAGIPLLSTEVPKLVGKSVWVWSKCEAKGVWLFVGDELTILNRGKIDGWVVARDRENREISLQTLYLSKNRPAYTMRATEKLETFYPKVFAEAYEIAWRYADLYGRLNYAHPGDEAPEEKRAYEEAYKCHSGLLSQLLGGGKSRTDVLSDERYEWLWSASPSVFESFCEGMESRVSPEFLEKAKAASVLANDFEAVISICGDIRQAIDELRRKPWLEDLSPRIPREKREALDREETRKRKLLIQELKEKLQEQRVESRKKRVALGF